MPDLPTREQLADVPLPVLRGLVGQHGEQARARQYDHGLQKDQKTWEAVSDALRDAAEGRLGPAAAQPRWLEPLARQRLKRMATRTSWTSDLPLVRLLEQTGLVNLPVDDDYVLAVVGALGIKLPGGRVEALRRDPELLERVVWRMFEVEGGGEVSLANVDRFTGPDQTWNATFLELVADATLPRARVLQAALAALGRDFSSYRASWFSALYNALEPNAQETAQDQALLRTLLRSDVTATVSFAVRHLTALQWAGLLEVAEIVPALQPAVLCRVKGTALDAVRLLSAMADQRGVEQVATVALQHPHADVQVAAASLLDKLGAGDVIDREELQPSVRGTAVVIEQPLALRPARVVVPVGHDDLLERMAGLLEDASDPLEVELVLAALATATHPDVLRPLLKRARGILQRGPREGVTPAWLSGQLARAVLIFSGEKVDRVPTSTATVDFLTRRIDDALLRHQPLLATPEHSAGWISPATVVTRLQQATVTPSTCDLVAGLLRLAPCGRQEALLTLRETGALNGEVAQVVRYALGAAPPDTRRRGLRRHALTTTPALWVAASRARAPLAVDPWLENNGLTGEGRSRPITTRVHFTSHTSKWQDRQGRHTVTYQRWTLSADAQATRREDEPTAAYGDPQPFRLDLEQHIGLVATIWPPDAEHLLLDGIDAVLSAARAGEVSHDASRVLPALGQHEGRLGELAHLALAAGLSAERADQRIRAADAVLELAARGTLTPEGLGLGLVAALPVATLNRWAQSLTDVASASGRNLVIDSLSVALPSFDRGARGLHSLLELLIEELLRAGRPTPPTLVSWLTGFTGTSRAAKAARRLVV